MDRLTSQYLDLVRLLSALAVFAAHAMQGDTAQALFGSPIVDGLPHHAVIVFFVLSGYVIGFTTDKKEKDWLSYTVARFTRIAPVVVAAILITLMLDLAGRLFGPGIYGHAYQYDSPLKYIILSLFISNHSWILAEPLFSNSPYWSINYEVWYYIIFGSIFFFPKRVKFYVIVFWLLAVGIKIPLLLPCWLFGYWAYRATSKPWPAYLCRTGPLLILCLAPEVIFLTFGVIAPIHNHLEIHNSQLPFLGVIDLGYSRYFLTDWLFAAMHAIHIAGFAKLAARSDRTLPLGKAIKFGADHTFGLYLFHLPLLLFMRAVTDQAEDKVLQFVVVTTVAFVISLFLASLVEPLRYPLRRFLTRTAIPTLAMRRRQILLNRARPKQ